MAQIGNFIPHGSLGPIYLYCWYYIVNTTAPKERQLHSCYIILSEYYSLSTRRVNILITMDAFIREINPRSDRLPLIFSGGLAKRGLSSLVKAVTG